MVIGSRFKGTSNDYSVTIIRRIAVKSLSKSASRAAQTTITDAIFGFRLIQQPLLGQFAETFANNYLGDTYEAIIAAGKANYKITEIEAKLHHWANGTSSAGFGAAFGFTLKGFGVAFLGLHKRLTPLRENS